MTELHEAAAAGDFVKVKLLLDNGANINLVSKYGCTPLHQAITSLNKETVKGIIKAGANVNARDYAHQTPLHWAANFGNSELCEILLDSGANVNAQDKSGQTPLHKAATKNSMPIAKTLIAYGADVTIKTAQGNSAKDLIENQDDKEKFAIFFMERNKKMTETNALTIKEWLYDEIIKLEGLIKTNKNLVTVVEYCAMVKAHQSTIDYIDSKVEKNESNSKRN